MLRSRGILPEDHEFALSVYGLSGDRAKLSLWRQETLPLPTAYLDDEDLVADLDQMVANAEQAGRSLRQTTRRLAEALLSPQPDRTPDRDAVRQLAEGLRADEQYWSRLERPFRQAMIELPEQGEATLARWAETVCAAARRTLEQVIAGLELSPRTLQAAYASGDFDGRWGAWKVLNVKLSPILKPYKEADHEQRPANAG